MRCGISTACFYPENTLLSLQQITAAGAPVTEVFLNTFSELEPPFISQLAAVARQGGVQVLSVHPFSSALEGFLFASRYEGRFADGIDLYRKYFAACQALGADKLVFHGDHARAYRNLPLEQYADRFCQLAALGREYGVVLCHENVAYCRLGGPAAVREIRPMLGEYAAFVLDAKQARRFGVPVAQMIDAMGGDIRLVHISDADETRDCLPPGAGEFDIALMLGQLAGAGYTGDMVIEVYREDFGAPQELTNSMAHMAGLLRAQGGL